MTYSSLSADMTSSTGVSFDQLFTFPRGDVDIKVTYKGQQVRGKVITHAMSMASLVWHKFHTPPWKNSDDPAVTEIDFSEDDGEALLILLRIVHLQLNEIPNTIDLMTFYNIAVLCEQYDCLHIISPWVKKWSEELESADVTGVDCVPSRKIYIYWVIGNIPAFQKLAASLVKCCKLATHPGSISWQILPEGLYESIEVVRDLTIQKLLDLPYNDVDHYIQAYMNMNEDVRMLCESGSYDCDIYNYGSLTLELTKLGLWPRKKSKEVMSSVNSLAEILKDLAIFKLGKPGSYNGCGSGGYADEVAQILNDIQDPTLESHIKHMEISNKISKISDDIETSDHPHCVRCSTCHSTVQECPPNPRKRPAE